MRTKTYSTLGIMLLALIMLAACASLNAKKFAVVVNDTYVAQYDDYLTFFVQDESGEWGFKEGTSADQRDALRKRRELLVDLDDMRKILNTFVVVGYLPPDQSYAELEAGILVLLRKLED